MNPNDRIGSTSISDESVVVQVYVFMEGISRRIVRRYREVFIIISVCLNFIIWAWFI